MEVVDDLVLFSKHDPELAEGFKWIDAEAFKRKITFYEMTYYILSKYDATEKAKQWMAGK